jgi:hypothetical protein
MRRSSQKPRAINSSVDPNYEIQPVSVKNDDLATRRKIAAWPKTCKKLLKFNDEDQPNSPIVGRADAVARTFRRAFEPRHTLTPGADSPTPARVPDSAPAMRGNSGNRSRQGS